VDEHRRNGAAADVEPRLDDRARSLGVWVRLQLELGVRNEEHLLEQVVEVLSLPRRDVRELRRAAPLLRLQALGRELGPYTRGIGVRNVDLVDRNDDRHVRGASVRNGLLRLRHHAVVRRDDEDRNVRHLRTPCPHGGERFVAWRVEERNLPAVVVGLVGTDVLRDSSRLRLDDRGLADCVEQRCLPVVDVSHDRHDRRARNEVALAVLERLGLLVLVGSVLDRQLTLGRELGRDQLDLVVREGLRDRDGLAEVHHEHDDLGRGHAERLGQVAHGDARLDRDRSRRCDDLARRLRAGRLALALLLTRVARARGGVVDDDAAFLARTRTTLTWPHRPVRSV
jgi:hypothetical protein